VKRNRRGSEKLPTLKSSFRKIAVAIPKIAYPQQVSQNQSAKLRFDISQAGGKPSPKLG